MCMLYLGRDSCAGEIAFDSENLQARFKLDVTGPIGQSKIPNMAVES